jgi:tetratricopeptide (TPR) repeat protein
MRWCISVAPSNCSLITIGEGNAYDALAEIFQKKGDQKQTAEVLAARVRYDENSLPTLKSLASLRAKLGDRAGAIEALRLSFYVSPFEYATHAQAGELSLEEKQYARALSEFQVVLALDPPNLAEANYNVASAYHLLGKQPEAKACGAARAGSGAELRKGARVVVEDCGTVAAERRKICSPRRKPWVEGDD